MRVRVTTSARLIAISLCLSAAIPASAQLKEWIWKDQWTWRDLHGDEHSRADLDKILKQHKVWWKSGKKDGSQADLTGADLRGLDLRGQLLEGALLSGADLSGADLSRANLSGADLINADLGGASLSDANLTAADLSGAFLGTGWTERLEWKQTEYIKALIQIAGADVARVVFEPTNLPRLEGIAQARGLELMTYRRNPGPLTQLRKQFQDAGYREQERAITCALNRREAELDSFVERWFKRVAFDFTCQYGLTPGRPLRIVAVLWLFFSIVYVSFIHAPGKSGIYIVAESWPVASKTKTAQIRPRATSSVEWWKLPFLWLPREWRVLRAAMFFSLLSAFDIGFHEFTPGSWLRKVTKRQYDLKAKGWARTVSGFQSLLSVYLIARWVLTYFGRPFG